MGVKAIKIDQPHHGSVAGQHAQGGFAGQAGRGLALLKVAADRQHGIGFLAAFDPALAERVKVGVGAPQVPHQRVGGV